MVQMIGQIQRVKRDAAAALAMARRAQTQAWTVLGVGLGGVALGAVAVAAVPSWGMLGVIGGVAAVLVGEAMVLRAPRRAETEELT